MGGTQSRRRTPEAATAPRRPPGGRPLLLERHFRRCGCLDKLRSPGSGVAEVSPLVEHLVNEKRRAEGRPVKYSRLVLEAQAAVPESVQKQIRLDVCRSFSSLPKPRPGRWGWPFDDSEAAQQVRADELFRILVASEYRATGRLRSNSTTMEPDPEEPTSGIGYSVSGASGGTGTGGTAEEVTVYVQGCSLLAAMCLGFSGGSQEDAFWILQHLQEDILGVDFFGSSVPLLGYHGDCAAAVYLTAAEAPNVARMLGPKRLADVITALAARCLLSGYVGFLADGPLLTLWEHLLEGHLRYPLFPRFALIEWLVGLAQHMEMEVVLIAGQARPEELVPMLFKSTHKEAMALPDEWRPSVRGLTEARVSELRQMSDVAVQAHLRSIQKRQVHESHAKVVWQSLDQASKLLQDSMLNAQAMIAVGSEPATGAV